MSLKGCLRLMMH